LFTTLYSFSGCKSRENRTKYRPLGTKTKDSGAVEKLAIKKLRLLRFARNDTETHFLSLRGAQRRSNLDFFNSSTATYFFNLTFLIFALSFFFLYFDFLFFSSATCARKFL
jgi:hypothetical protein